MAHFFSKERITAGPQFNRWLVPPAALAVALALELEAKGYAQYQEEMAS